MVIEDYGESDSKLVKVSIICRGDKSCRRNPKVREVFLRFNVWKNQLGKSLMDCHYPFSTI
jgi:hypothetical protein